jgi:hypothetical protein
MRQGGNEHMNFSRSAIQQWVTAAAVAMVCCLGTENGLGQATSPVGMLHPQRTTILSRGCTYNKLQLTFRTGNDDLRGGQNNLNVEIHFADGTMEVADNVNRGANWANNTTNLVTVPLKQPVAPNQIQSIGLVHIAKGGFTPPTPAGTGALATPVGPALAPIYAAQGARSEDNWDMAEFQASAVSDNLAALPVASFGFHRFTGSAPNLLIPARPNLACPDPNQVSKLSFVFQTGDDDLRGGNDNLDVEIRFTDGKMQVEKNVNQTARWADGSAHGVSISLNQPVPKEQIASVVLETTFAGGYNGDNWNMNSVQINALTEKGSSSPIASFGFHRFSADPTGPKARRLTVPIK